MPHEVSSQGRRALGSCHHPTACFPACDYAGFRRRSQQHVVNQPRGAELGGQRASLTIFFTDIADFTTISERLEPEALVDQLGEYRRRVRRLHVRRARRPLEPR